MKKLSLLLLLLFACDDPAMIVVDDTYADGTRVDAVWWSQTLVPDVVAPGGESPAYRAVPGLAPAYVLLERNGGLFVARSASELGADPGKVLHVVAGPTTLAGDCAYGAPLTQAEADFITESIFPGPFDGAIYDATTCKTFEPARDAGAD